MGYERRDYYKPLDERTADTIKRNQLYPTFRLARKFTLLIKAVGWFREQFRKQQARYRGLVAHPGSGKESKRCCLFHGDRAFQIMEEMSRTENTSKDEIIANLRTQLADAKEDIEVLEVKNKGPGMELQKAKRIEKRQLEQQLSV